MAKSLREALGGFKAPSLAAPATAGSILQTMRARKGKAVDPSATPAPSSLGAQVAAGAAQAQQAGVRQGAQIQQQALGAQQAAQAQQAATQQQGLNLQDLNMQANFAQQSDQLLAELERGRTNLGSLENRSRLEQLGFTLSMQDREYLHNLRMASARHQVRQGILNNKDLLKLQLGNSMELLTKGLDWQALIAGTQREQQIALSEINIDYAMDLANSQLQARRDAAPWAAGATAAIGGLQVAGAAEEREYREAQRKRWEDD